MTTFWPKRDEDGRHVTVEETKPKCPICNDTGMTIPPYEEYDGAIVHYRIKCECTE